MLEEYLKDRFVAGLASGRIKDRVSEEEHTVKLKEIIDIALKKEAALTIATAPAELNKLEIQGRRKAGSEQQKKQARVADTVRDPKKKCNVCGEADHNFFTCKYKKYKCKRCKKIGHLIKVCRLNKNRDIKNVEVENDSVNYVDIMNIQSSSSVDPYVVNLIVEGKPIKFEVDSGAGVSIIERSAYDKLCNNVRLEKTAIRLRTYEVLVFR
ncbi:hypothetical protein QE152_g1360 [Popillia japonica]|uniref:CCHC-type domain-containing protein n=1 Tax=Popillia japonica TaxID=7064 RepID=A0AAW1N7K1_POPJA